MAGKNGKKPAATLMAERAEEQARKATAEMLGPQGPAELPGPPEAPTGEQLAAAIQEQLAEGPRGFADLVRWTRQKFGVSMEVADGFVLGEIELGAVKENAGACYTVASLETVALTRLKGGQASLVSLTSELDGAIGATAQSEAAKHIDEAIQGLIARGLILSEVRDGESWLSLAPVPISEAIAYVAAERPDLVEAGPVAILCKTGIEGVEAHDDHRDLRQDSKRLVSVLSLLRRRKEVRDNIKEARSELKEWTDELKELDAQIDGIGNDETKIEPAPKVATGEPEDVALPFGDLAIIEEDTDAIEAAGMLESVAGPVT